MEISLEYIIGIMIFSETVVIASKKWFELTNKDVPYFVASISFIISLLVVLIFSLGFEAFVQSIISIVALLGFHKVGKKLTTKRSLP